MTETLTYIELEGLWEALSHPMPITEVLQKELCL